MDYAVHPNIVIENGWETLHFPPAHAYPVWKRRWKTLVWNYYLREMKVMQWAIKHFLFVFLFELAVKLIFCISFQNKVRKCLTEYPKIMKFSTLFPKCNNKVISGHFTCRAGLDHTLTKPIVPKHVANSALARINRTSWSVPADHSISVL